MNEEHTAFEAEEKKDFSIGNGWFQIKQPNARIALNTNGEEFIDPELNLHFDPDAMEDPDDARLHINAKDGGLTEAEAYVHLSQETVRDLMVRLSQLEQAMEDDERYFER